MRSVLVITAFALVLWGAAAAAQTRPVTRANPIDLNSASRDELMTLDGIGEVKADAIIRARPLVERRIVPEALYDKIAAKVFARPPPAPPPPAKPAAPAPAGPIKRG